MVMGKTKSSDWWWVTPWWMLELGRRQAQRRPRLLAWSGSARKLVAVEVCGESRRQVWAKELRLSAGASSDLSL